jgi:hypothetical protein
MPKMAENAEIGRKCRKVAYYFKKIIKLPTFQHFQHLSAIFSTFSHFQQFQPFSAFGLLRKKTEGDMRVG